MSQNNQFRLSNKHFVILLSMLTLCLILIPYAILAPIFEKGEKEATDWAKKLETSTNCDELNFAFVIKGNIFSDRVIKTATDRMEELKCP